MTEFTVLIIALFAYNLIITSAFMYKITELEKKVNELNYLLNHRHQAEL